MKIKTKPVYSKLADSIPPEIQLPHGWHLSQHQVETYHALTSGDYDVVFNTAMTGDGKSLAGLLPLIQQGDAASLFAMYPTNELARDQEKQLGQTQQDWQVKFYPKFLNGATLDDLMIDDDFQQRGDALMKEIRNNNVLLTNPDIFHYIMSYFYRQPQDAADKIIGPLVEKFQQFTFDEFHVFEIPQVISVMNAMLFINEMAGNYHRRFLFLSATPNEQMETFLKRSGLRYYLIQPQEKGWYQHVETPPDPSQWRRILHGTDIHFDQGGVEEWVAENLDTVLLPFFEQNRPKAKGAIIVNSVAAAKRLLNRLKPKFEAHQLTVADNTGLTSQTGRAASYEADLLIGTSTIDVGVDFKINFLLFESLNAGTFLQRLGRLGRHDGYERHGQKHTFECFEAYALVPNFVTETLFKGRDGAKPLLPLEMPITRQTLTEAIEQAYPPPVTYHGYVHEWGQLQSCEVMLNLSHKTIREVYKPLRERLGLRYEQTFNIHIKNGFGQRKRLQEAKQTLLLDEANSFRGGSYFDCAILDETESQYPADPKLADLFMLVANGRLATLTEDEFFNRVKQLGLPERRFKQANGTKGPLGYFRLLGWQDERQFVTLRLRGYIDRWDSNQFGQAIVMKGFEIDAVGMSEVNRHLTPRHLPVTLCMAHDHPLALKRELYLPLLFPVFQFTSLDNRTGCVAFGRHALLLHTQLKRRPKIQCGGGAVIL